MRISVAVACGLVSLCLRCSSKPERLPPLGEALIVVDTDAPVPELAGRLRVDVFRLDGLWIDSRDMALVDPDDWPASFSVYLEEGTQERTAVVRLRAYPDGKVRDYRGERYLPPPGPGNPADPWEPPPPTEGPRLIRDGRDVTPSSEPLPSLAIDRIVRVHVVQGTRGSVRVVLRTVCAGTMADLYGQTTCVDARAHLVPVGDARLEKDMSVPRGSSAVGSAIPPRPCTEPPRPPGRTPDGTPLLDEEICIPGGAFFLGDPSLVLTSPTEEARAPLTGPSGTVYGSVPERVAVMGPLRVDRYEVTVARWRHARNVDGFGGHGGPSVNNGALATSLAGLSSPVELCTYTSSAVDRESYPVTCLPWAAARAFCQFYGGDLLTEAQWEYVASAAGHDLEAPYPWGRAAPSCDRATYGRADDENTSLVGASVECLGLGFGVQPVTTSSDPATGDVTPLGVVGMAGNVQEYVLDSFRSYSSRCWATATLVEPTCWEEGAAYRSNRGGSWSEPQRDLLAGIRRALDAEQVNPLVGFRCARRGDEP